MNDFKEIKIDPVNEELRQKIKDNWDHIAKPLDGLGRFEAYTAKIGAILGTEQLRLQKKAIIVMCADNGIVEEHVSQSGQEVTTIVTRFMGLQQTSVGKMAAVAKADVIPVDIGINGKEVMPGVLNRKVACGTKNFLKEPAMTKEQVLQAVQVGIQLVLDCKSQGYQLLGMGEMGIGNTTTSSALAAFLLGCQAQEVTGPGAGLSAQGLKHKVQVIQTALNQYQIPKQDVLGGLCTFGGLDIAGLVGVCIGGAIYHIPVVIDGVISAAAALTAERLCPGVRDYLIPSHQSKEPGMIKMMKELDLEPVIDAGLALGEGTGAVMMFSLLELALSLYEQQTTFQTISLKPYERFTKKERE